MVFEFEIVLELVDFFGEGDVLFFCEDGDGEYEDVLVVGDGLVE